MEISWFDFILFSLAVFRLTRLFVFDQITSFLRAPFMMDYEETNDQGNKEIYVIPREGGLRGFIGELLSCYWCTGIWVAIGLWGLFELYPNFAEPFIIIAAIAGFAAIIESAIQSKNNN